MSTKEQTTIIFNDRRAGDFDSHELRTLFDLFKGIYESCERISAHEPIEFTEFAKEEFERAMNFLYFLCKNPSESESETRSASSQECARLMSFLGLRLKLEKKASFARQAAKMGDLDLLVWALENGCPKAKEISLCAAKGGHLDCLIFVHQSGCPWHFGVCFSAAKRGHLDCLRYAREHGCPWDETVCHVAAMEGHLDCLKYVFENGCPRSTYTCFVAADGDHLDCLKWALENGFYIDDSIISRAPEGSNCLRWLRENGYSRNEGVPTPTGQIFPPRSWFDTVHSINFLLAYRCPSIRFA